MIVDRLRPQEDMEPDPADAWADVFWWCRRGEQGLDRNQRRFRHWILTVRLPRVARWTLP